MAVKGNGYVKTTWAFQERPVSSAKLNAWDDRIERAFERAFRLLSLAWGGGDGVLRGADEELAVTPTATAGFSVRCGTGWAFISGFPFRVDSAATTPPVEPPAALQRIDLVQAHLPSGEVRVKQGETESAPAAPAPDDDCIALAELRLRAGMTRITAEDNGVDGYIHDVRNFL